VNLLPAVAIGFEIEQERARVSACTPEMSHLVVGPFGRPAFRFRLAPRQTVGGRVFALGRWRRGPVGARRSALVTLQSGLEELRDPLEGRGRFGGGLVLVDLAGILTHGGEEMLGVGGG